MIFSNIKERNRFLKFAVVGTIGAIIDFGLFNICTSIFSILPVVSSMISFTTAVISNFIWNRFWTYPDSRSKTVRQQLGQFLIISLMGLGIRTPLFALLERGLTGLLQNYSMPFNLKPVFIAHNISLAIVIVIVMFWNFFANRFWTYSDVKS